MTRAAVQTLGLDVFAWRDEAGFRSSDDIPRIDHAPSWTPEFTPESVDERRAAVAGFRRRWDSIDVEGAEPDVHVDHRVIGSVLARASWELDTLRNWERDAVFLVSQILGPWFDLLLPVPPFSPQVQTGLIDIARGIPARVGLARENLARAGSAATARVAIDTLDGIDERLAASVAALDGFVTDATLSALVEAAPAAGAALADLGRWLEAEADTFADAQPVGREAFVWFLRHVALIADEPENLVRAAEQDYRRAVVAETVTRNRHSAVAPDPIAGSIEQQVARQAEQEAEVRAFYERENLLTQPDSLGRYLVADMPPYLEPLQFLGVTDDLTSQHRLDVDGISYMPRPRADLPYFYAANARDPRLGIVHEGAHYKQLALSWAHENPLRRHYVDSVANEGIAFYNEEMMLTAGLFADAPHSEEVIHNFNRLRSLRVVVDVNLATGVFSLDEAARFFVDLVPMDAETAIEETAMYVATPGLAMSYHVGKQQLTRLMTDAIRTQGPDFDLRAFHDYVWRNGNIPFSLLRFEMLGDRSELDVLDAAGPAW